MDTIDQRLASLRDEMKKTGVAAYIIPSSDEHQSEYVADRSKIREWISGFDGSAGIVVVTHDKAELWTDSRYFLQAEDQLRDSEFVLQKMKNRAISEFLLLLREELAENDVVACDGLLFSKGQVEGYGKLLATANIKLDSALDLISSIWIERPLAPTALVYEHDIKYAGKSRNEKLNDLRSLFLPIADSYLISALDDIAWLFNLRGRDVECNPVFISYAIVNKDDAIIFVADHKIQKELIDLLQSDNIRVFAYSEIISHLNNLDENLRLHISSSDISMSLFRAINCHKIQGTNFIRNTKSIKNEIEIKNTRNAMEKDGVALTRMYMWLEKTLKERKVKETEVRDQLIYFRSLQDLYIGESFGAIVGFRGNGAIVHYSAEESSCAEISGSGMLLIDSGGQYLNGTTDITRTTHTGTPSAEEKLAFTMVLKGNICLDTAKFPKGTKGIQLDTMARMFLWENGMDYGHGTGHGVGFFLNVHEPPQGIAPMWGVRSKTVFQEGMITSNEPGFYKSGEFGIRIENLLLTKFEQKTEYGEFLAHETLTLFPIELKLIDETLMNAKEKAWFNRYHQEVYRRLAPLLTNEEQKWLKVKCKPLN